LIRTGKIKVNPLITHQYHALEEVEQAFKEDSKKPDYIKGILAFGSAL